MFKQPLGGFLMNLTKARDVCSGRVSSWDQSGRNQDYWIIPPGETIVLADIEGPGCITHIWMTEFCRRILGPTLIDPVRSMIPFFEINNALGVNWEVSDPDYYRKVLIKIYWDDQEHPSVLVPLGDFFCVGHSMPANFASIPFTVSVNPEEQHKFGGNAALNCYLLMPFNKRARIEIENQNDIPYGQYFHIDFELHREPIENLVYFHAQWRRENPCDGWGPDIQVNSPEVNLANLDGKDNYVILEAKGQGHYIGCNLSVTHFQGTWWGEGDDMIFIDDEKWPPSFHGTGSEDYFNHAWGMQKNAFPFSGSILHESDVAGYQVSYRFHLVDPIHFSKSTRVTMEHGHANHLADDWCSTAYWYQTLPSKFFDILPVEQRLPIRRQPVSSTPSTSHVKITKEMREKRAAFHKRYKEYLATRDTELKERIENTRRHSEANIKHVKQLRKFFMERTSR